MCGFMSVWEVHVWVHECVGGACVIITVLCLNLFMLCTVYMSKCVKVCQCDALTLCTEHPYSLCRSEMCNLEEL